MIVAVVIFVAGSAVQAGAVNIAMLFVCVTFVSLKISLVTFHRLAVQLLDLLSGC